MYYCLRRLGNRHFLNLLDKEFLSEMDIVCIMKIRASAGEARIHHSVLELLAGVALLGLQVGVRLLEAG